nr:Scarecrow-like protein 14 [Ipomoea batatas]
MNLAQSATSVHVIDFGILYGFQWPCFIQRLSSRKGGPPRLRITGIDLPQPGFRPAERVEETGKRLANYAERFNVPFEFNAIAKKWETIKIEDIKINKDEVLVERVERPETYKQWHVRNMRAGFLPLPLNKEIMKMSRDRAKVYNKDFVIDEDGEWLLQGWKGRIVYALSSWRPAS